MLCNRALIGFLDTFWTAFGEFLIDFPADAELDLADHVAILEAIKARDLDQARQALQQNLRRMQDNMRKSLQDTD